MRATESREAAAPAEAPATRPPVSVVVPFHGNRRDAQSMLAGFGRIRSAGADELLVVDNTPNGVCAGVSLPDRARVVAAARVASAYHARNAGARAARNPWILFSDADCVPEAAILDRFFVEPVAENVGAIAGDVVTPEPDGLLSRWSESRQIFSQARALAASHPAAATACLLVRAAAWRAIGGFQDGIRSGGDFDLCWRLQGAGWRLDYRPGARVEHPHRRRLVPLLRQAARYAGGLAWLERRHPQAVSRPRLLPALGRSAAAGVVLLAGGRLRRAALRGIDMLVILAGAVGAFRGNAAPLQTRHPEKRGVTVFADQFPARSETFVWNEARALAARGFDVRLEAVAHSEHPAIDGWAGVPCRFVEDEGPGMRLVATVRLVARHPVACLADLFRRRRFAADERMPLRALAPAARRAGAGPDRHLHAHFASLAAADALRVGQLLGRPVSVEAHAHEIFARPRALSEKLSQATFATADCDYSLRHLRSVVAREAHPRIHVLVMGVDAGRFQRLRPSPGTGTVVSVGRYVEKKGFEHLIEATSLLAVRGRAPRRVVIAGDGPLRGRLEALIAERGLAGVVQLPNAWGADAVREILEDADLFAMPCVVAADGDRDTMPVAVKEAMAMEVPVVASDEVGLPELVKPESGRLVRPGDPAALASGIEELLALDVDQRSQMGRAARLWVLEHATLERQAARLGELIEAAAPGGSSSA